MNTGGAERRLDTLKREKQHLEVPDNANAIVCVAASLLEAATVGKKGATNKHVQSPSSVRSNAHNDGIAGLNFALAQNAGPKERQGQSRSTIIHRRTVVKEFS